MKQTFLLTFVLFVGITFSQTVPDIGNRPDTLSVFDIDSYISRYEEILKQNDEEMIYIYSQCDTLSKINIDHELECRVKLKEKTDEQMKIMSAYEGLMKLRFEARQKEFIRLEKLNKSKH